MHPLRSSSKQLLVFCLLRRSHVLFFTSLPHIGTFFFHRAWRKKCLGERHAPLLKPSSHATHTCWIAGVVVVLLLTLIAFQVLLTFLTPTPTITLAPIVRDLSITATMVAAPGATTSMHIPARQLTTLTLIQSTTAVET